MSCEKIHYYPDRPLGSYETKILAHRGGGNSSFHENTLSAAQYGLQNLNGIEIDIQFSKNNTLWLAHDTRLPVCGNNGGRLFRNTNDDEIMLVNNCLDTLESFSKLENVFQTMSEYYPDKYISLDVKAWEFDNLGIIAEMNRLADRIISLHRKYPEVVHVMVESETGTFLDYMEDHSSEIETYLTTNGDFERGMMRALRNEYDGISFKFKYDEEITPEHVSMLRRKGLKIQLWTINDMDYIKEALLDKPDFIQTDNISYFISR
jgi:glycerophosphoryl diester phosphodiesterase